ncbi:MAG TPA: hypothetical protein VK338_02295 [Candidatus Nitrosocosmicus sp.]|nr:hypothetical protein [Candidatus Nitrosocosmicus sp.]
MNDEIQHIGFSEEDIELMKRLDPESYVVYLACEQEDQEKVRVISELSAKGWVSGNSFDYEVSSNGEINIRAKNGIIYNELLPPGWKVQLKVSGGPEAISVLQVIEFDPRLESAESEGLIELCHEGGHAFDPKAGEHTLQALLHDPRYLLYMRNFNNLAQYLEALPNDNERLQVLLQAYNFKLEIEARGTDYGLSIAEKLGINLQEYIETGLEKSLKQYYEYNLCKVAALLKSTTTMQDDEELEGILIFDPQEGIKAGAAISSLISRNLTFGQVLRIAKEIRNKRKKSESIQ